MPQVSSNRATGAATQGPCAGAGLTVNRPHGPGPSHSCLEGSSPCPTDTTTSPSFEEEGRLGHVPHPGDGLVLHDVALDEVTVQHRLDSGAYSYVHAGRFRGQPVAVKLPRLDGDDPASSVETLWREIGVVSRMARHGGLCRVIATGSGPIPFLVLERLQPANLGSRLGTDQQQQPSGGTLSQRMKRTRLNKDNKHNLPLLERLRMANEVAKALCHLHETAIGGSCVMHRDLKPANVGFAEDGTVRLFDFGLSTIMESRAFADEMYKLTGDTGSQRYCAPEVMLGRAYNEKADVYSFTLVVWEICTLKRPFAGFSAAYHRGKVTNGFYRPPLDKSWPRELQNLFTSGWHSNPHVRPTARAMSQRLSAIIHALTPPPRRSSSGHAGSGGWIRRPRAMRATAAAGRNCSGGSGGGARGSPRRGGGGGGRPTTAAATAIFASEQRSRGRLHMRELRGGFRRSQSV